MLQKEQNISTVKQRILQFVNDSGMTHREFYLKSGVSRGTLTNKTGISEETLAKIFATFPSLNKNWVINGEIAPNFTPNSAPNIAPNLETSATNEVFPGDGGNGCKNCQILETKYFEARDYLQAKEKEVKELVAENAVLKHENGQLKAENAQLRGQLGIENKQQIPA